MKTKSKITLQIITGILSVIHLAFIVHAFYQGTRSFLKPVDNLFIVLFLILLSAFVLSWKRMKTAGILIMCWVAGVWILDLYIIGDLSDTDSGYASLTLWPVLLIGVFFLLEWFKSSKTIPPTKQQRWKFVLRTLLINYAVLYLILVFAELSGATSVKQQIDYSSLPHILNPPLLLIFIAGFVVSWKWELFAGIIFLIWCAISVYAFFGFPGTYYSGPWGFCVLPILLQGIFYIKNYYQFRSKKKLAIEN